VLGSDLIDRLKRGRLPRLPQRPRLQPPNGLTENAASSVGGRSGNNVDIAERKARLYITLGCVHPPTRRECPCGPTLQTDSLNADVRSALAFRVAGAEYGGG